MLHFIQPSTKELLSNLLNGLTHNWLLKSDDIISDSFIELKQKDTERSLSYRLHFILESIKGLARKQKVQCRTRNDYRVNFEFKETEHKKWMKLLGLNCKKTMVPFYLKSSTTHFLQLMKDLNVNLKNVLHLRNEMEFVEKNFQLDYGKFSTTARIENIYATSKNKAIVSVTSKVFDSKKSKLIEITDYFMLLNLSQECIKNIKNHQNEEVINYRSWLIASKFDISDTASDNSKFIPSNMGVAYGKVSGDLNMCHTTKFTARLFGFKKPFVQGLCTASVILSTELFGKGLDKFSINFLKPVHTNESIKYGFENGAYRIESKEGKLLAHGKYEC